MFAVSQKECHHNIVCPLQSTDTHVRILVTVLHWAKESGILKIYLFILSGSVKVLTTCQPAGVTAVLTLAACPQWTSSGDSPAQTCSVNVFQTDFITGWTLNLLHILTFTLTRVYLVEGGQVVSGLDEEGLVDSGMVHVVGGCCHETKEHVQRTQLLCQLQHTKGWQGNGCSLCRRDTWFLTPAEIRRGAIKRLICSVILTGIRRIVTMPVSWWWLIQRRMKPIGIRTVIIVTVVAPLQHAAKVLKGFYIDIGEWRKTWTLS